jgi:hypothetical protein
MDVRLGRFELSINDVTIFFLGVFFILALIVITGGLK